MSIKRILNQTEISASGLNATLNGYGETSKLLCEAPAELELPNGFYSLAGSPGPSFHVSANGGTQTWELTEGKSAETLTGAALVIGSLLGIIVGAGSFAGSSDNAVSNGLTISGISLAAMAGSIILIKDGSPTAKLVEF